MDAIHLEVTGHGPTVLFLAGLGGGRAFWKPLSDQLSDRCRVVCFEYQSDSASLETIDHKSTIALQVLDELECDQALVFGHSSGGATAQRFALSSADRVNQLILSGTWAGPSTYIDTIFSLRSRLLNALGGRDFLLDGLSRAMPPDWLEAQLEAHGPDGLFAFRGEVDAAIETGRIEQIKHFDNRENLERITCPTHVVYALDDSVFPASCSKELAKFIPGAQLSHVEYGAHLAPMINPEPYAELILRHLSTA